MATNADNASDDSKTVTADDLRQLKYGQDGVDANADETTDTNGTDNTEETGEEDGQTDDQTTDNSEETEQTGTADESAEFVKELPNIKGDTIEEYARSLEKAYKESTTEALRLKALADAKTTTEKIGDDKQEVDTSDPIALFMKQKMDEEIATSFADFSKEYPQVTDPNEYNKFTLEVATLSNTILQSQKRMASPKELYQKAAVILGWESDKVTSKDRLNAAVKGSAAAARTSSTVRTPVKSKVTDQMIALNRMMYPNKTDDQIRKELEPYVK